MGSEPVTLDGAGIAERGARIPAVVWGIYLACSWTWCIGMFLPVLLVRDFGVWGWVAFAVPNVVGAGAVGWYMRSAEQSRALVEKHRIAFTAFSAVTAAYQIFFATWIFGRMGLDAHDWGLATLAVALLIVFRNGAIWPRRMPYMAIGLLAVSAVCVAGAGRSGRLVGPSVWLRSLSQSPPAGSLALGVACAVGFLFCPALDVTFQRARQQMSAREAKMAFGVGFGVLFLAMIAFSLAYAPVLLMGLIDGREWMSTVVLWWVAIHFVAQLGFTIGVHWQEGAAVRTAADWKRAYVMILGTAVLGVVAAIAVRWIHQGRLEGGEVVYRVFLSCYALVFPAYVWLCMMPGGELTGRKLAVAGGALLVAGPMYWVAFIEGKIMWALPAVGVVLVSRLLVGPKPRAAEISGG